MYLIPFLGLVTLLSFPVNGDRGQLEITVDYKPDVCEFKAKGGDRVSIHYTGKLENGQVFDSSIKAGRDPIQFTLGANQVIPGWESGIEGMCIGERRQLAIPPQLAYGEKGRPPVIPENAWLYFETELMDLESSPRDPISVEWVFGAIQFWAIPVGVLLLAFKIYQRYQEDTSSKHNKSSNKQASKKNRRR